MENNINSGRDRDLVLAPGEFAFVLDTTKGLVNTMVGPYKTSMSNTDQTVIWDRDKRRIRRVDPAEAIQTNPVAPEGFYIALFNPAPAAGVKDGDAVQVNVPPRDGVPSSLANLKAGHRVNIHGPVAFPLWPGQFAMVIRGHHLRSNQYLLVQVYNDAEATANWKQAVLKPQGDAAATPIAPLTFVPGQLMVIKGTDVAFFMPPTGIKVLAEADGSFVREAVTLERLEYCILLDEDGNKRFVQGPAVVFPEPTEQFVMKDGSRKFRAIELNENSGLYIKVIADYEDSTGTHKVGDELFITGKEQAIYFQREEHSIIRYGDQTKHYAVAVPPGEGRYVMNRNTGAFRLAVGPQMLLCDPREEVIIRRVLSPKEAALWYPGNAKAIQVNAELEQLGKDLEADMPMASPGSYEVGRPIAAALYSASANMLEREDRVRTVSRQIAGDMMQRGTKFTPPRTVTLDTKYEGAVSITVWPGYAVMIVNKTGARRVVVGPETVLLQYDETLAMLELSTGTPKVDTNLLQTVYLRVGNNKVSDKFIAETGDLVKVTITLSYRLNFEGEDREKWFSVENYIRLLCDHMRSLVRNTAKRTGIAEFYGNTIDIVRDATLGKALSEGAHRPGRTFDENGMKVYDVEVLDVAIQDASVSGLLGTAQKEALTSALAIAKLQRVLADTTESERIKREIAVEVKKTEDEAAIRENEKVAAQLSLNLARVDAEAQVIAKKLADALDEQNGRTELNTAEIERRMATAESEAKIKTQLLEIELRAMAAQTKEIVERMGAIDGNLAVAMTTFADQALAEKMVTTLAPLAAMSGVSAADIFGKLLEGTPLEGMMKALGARTRMPALSGSES